MITKIEDTQNSFALALDKRWISEPAIVLLGYLLLGVVMLLAPGSLLQTGLAVVLILFGPGFALVAALFPRPGELDALERTVLAAGLSLAIVGITGFLLAYSPWGLHLLPLLTAFGLFNLGCYLVVWYHWQRFPGQKQSLWSRGLATLTAWRRSQSLSNQLVTIGLIALLISGGWVFNRAMLMPKADPPMTEFYLLGPSGLVQDYPEAALYGESLAIGYGIANREEATMLYEVRVLVNGEFLDSSQPISLKPGETQESQIELVIPEQTRDLGKLEFVLYRENELYRALHLWLKFDQAQPLPSILSSVQSSG